MELGQGKLLRTGLNALYQAIHPIHGLAWTDGTQVVLTNLQLHSGEAKFGDSTVLGQFEHVYGVSWAPPGAADTPTLLAVQHEKCVIVWQLCPSPAEEPSKWLMSQPCEIRQSCPVLPQGCVWHPESAILTVLTARDVSVFYNIHGDSSQVKVDVSTQGLIHCACWTQDGQRLVVAAGSSLHSYIWDSAQKTLHRCSLCPVFDVDSYVRSIGATVDSQVAIATELPLDKICGLNASGTFDVPPSGEDTCLRALPVTDPLSSETNSETPVSSSFSEPLDVTHIHFNRFKSEGSSLTCLRKKDYLTGTGLDSSHLVLLTFEKEVTCNRKVIIPGILVPDLIAFNLKAQAVAVASNTSNVIFIYSVIPLLMPNIQQIQLESNERPKGICFLTDKLLLILVGRQKSTDSAFLPSSKSDQYMICLIVREVMLKEDSPVTLSENQSDNSAFSTLINKTSIKKLIEDLLPDFCHQSRGLLFTANSSSQSGRPGRTLIEEIESPASSICDGSTVLETLDARPVNWSVTLPRPSGTPAHTSTAEPPNLEREKETYQLSKELEVVSRNLSEVQRHLSELSNFLHNGKKSSPVYPLSQDLPYVHITCQEDSLPLCHLRSPEYALLLLQLSHVSRVRLCDPIDGSPPGSPVPGILPGKNTGVGCHSLLQCMKVKSESEVAQLYPTLSDPMDCNLPGSSAHGIFQARVLEWVPLPSPEYALGNQKTSCGSLYFSGLEPKSAISEKCHFVRPVFEKRMMLLCNGKLRLSTVQQTFGLSLVEMLHDSHWILLCADSEGFIPLIFTATQEIIIRDGRSDDFQNSASEP